MASSPRLCSGLPLSGRHPHVIRVAGAIGFICAVLAIVLLAVGVREGVVIVPLLVIGLGGLLFTVGGAAGAATTD
jgi:hypothetical protein